MKKKALVIITLLSVISLSGIAQESRITARLRSASLKQVFDLIQQQSDFIIFYNDNQVDLKRKVSVNADDIPVEEVLQQALKNTGLSYKIFERQIIILKDKTNTLDPLSGNLVGPAIKRKLEGKVTDSSGNPLPGVSVVVVGGNTGVTTDWDGKYSILLPVDAVYLNFSFVGMKPTQEMVTGKNVVNVVLAPDDFGVEEVIVSALGIRRDEKSMSYATQTIDFDNINSREYSFVSGLAGKVSGMEINRSASGAGGSSKILLRGNKSLSGSSEPLFVIDGIPMANSKGRQLGLFDGSDQGDGLSQINPEDIESITVLKGANAAALYGSQGANGVILINTKRGSLNGLKANFSSYFTVEQIQKTPDLQYRYGAVGNAIESWGTTRGTYDDSFVKDFFKTGTNLINSVSISGGNQRTTTYFSATNTATSGVIPKNHYQKNNISFKQSANLLDGRVNLGSSVILSNELVKNRNLAGYYLNPLTGLYFFPRSRDFDDYKNNYQYFDTDRNMYLQNWIVEDHFQSNPYWIINNEPRVDKIKRLIATVNAAINFNPKLKLEFRANYDFAEKTYEEKHKAGSNITNVSENGRWVYTKLNDELLYGDAILTYNDNFGKFRFNSVFGTSYQKSTFGQGIAVDTGTIGLIYPNEFYFQNIDSRVQVLSVLSSRLIKEAVFGSAQLGYKEKIFAEISGRNDWASSLYGTGNESYFYPSCGLTGILDELFQLPEFVDFGKLRASLSRVSNEVPFNRVNPQNTISVVGVERNTTRSFDNLRPERINSLELGTDWKLFKNKLGLNLTYYKVMSRDQYIELPAPSGSGYSSYYVNAGKISNGGLELTAQVGLVQNSKLLWTTTLNYADNKNKIIRLHPQLNEPIVLSDNEGYQLIIKEGGSFGDIYGYKFARDDAGRILLSDNGTILKTENPVYLGNSNPRWSMSLDNRFAFGDFELDILVGGKFGGKVVSQTEAMLDGYGVSERTAFARDRGYVIINAVMPDGTEVEAMDPHTYYKTVGDRNGIKEAYTYSRSNIRLAQLSLSYRIPVKGNTIKNVQLSAVGQNLFFLYCKAPFDPEVTLNTLIADQAIDSFSVPSTRTCGLSVRVQF